MEGVESAKERREKTESKGVSEEPDRDPLYEPIKPIGPVLSHHFGIVFTCATLNNFLTVDELKREMRGKENKKDTRRTFG